MSSLDWIIIVISVVGASIIAEVLVWRKARKKGHKDLIDIIKDKFHKNKALNK
jgi:hypothetical protein